MQRSLYAPDDVSERTVKHRNVCNDAKLLWSYRQNNLSEMEQNLPLKEEDISSKRRKMSEMTENLNPGIGSRRVWYQHRLSLPFAALADP